MSLGNRNKTGLGEKIDSYEFDFDPAAWEDMEALLDGKKPSRKIFPFTWLFKIFGGMVVLVGIAMFSILQNKEVNQVQETTELTPPTSEVQEITTQDEIGHSAKTEIIATTENTSLSEEKGMKITKPATKVETVNDASVTATSTTAKSGFSENRSLENWASPYVPAYVWENTNSNFVEELNSKLITANRKFDSKKVYLQLDKTAFESGQEILFSAFVRDVNSLNPVSKNEALQLVLENSEGELLEKISINVENGFANGTIKIPEKEPEGTCKLKVYNTDQNNNAFLEKAIVVLGNGEEFLSPKKNSNPIDLQFFPEGGDLIADFSTKVAFKAVNEFGQPLDVEGIILDENSNEVSKFKSHYNGIGGFDFLAKANKNYTAKITSPIGIEQVYKLPEVNSEGFTIRFEGNENGQNKFKCSTTKNEVMKVVVRSGGKIVQSKSIFPPVGFMEIDKSNLTEGIAQITIFDSYHVAQAERLFFVENKEKLNINFKKNKEKYTSGDKISMTVEVTDSNGKGVAGQFSLVVTDEEIERQENILSALLLESELQGNVHNPSFYFEKIENEAFEKQQLALDYLMLTNRWNRLDWERIVFNSTADADFVTPQKSNEILTTQESSAKTIYWNPLIKTNANGRATIEFEAPDSRIPFQVILEGIGNNGQIGYGVKILNPEK